MFEPQKMSEMTGRCGAGLVVLLVSVGLFSTTPWGEASEGPPVGWNNFAVPGLAPQETELSAHRASASDADRDTCMSRLKRVVNANVLSGEAKEHLLPLADWALPLKGQRDDRVPRRGNVFIVRKTAGSHVLQVYEGLGCVTMEIRRADGGRLTDQTADLEDYALDSARLWLSDVAQPEGNVHRTSLKWAPQVAMWATRDVNDSVGFRFHACRAYTDGTYLVYEVRGFLNTKRAFQPPPPYMFGGASEMTQPTLEPAKVDQPGAVAKPKPKPTAQPE